MKRHEAIEFAARAHLGQIRKGSDIPYISHPFEVALLLDEAGADDTLFIAGLLHDTLEDTSVTPEAIRERFGEEVLTLVQNASEDKSKTWEERKTRTIDRLTKTRDQRIVMLACADKAANLRSTRYNYEEHGEKVWDRFNRGKDQFKWYYHGVIKALAEPERKAEDRNQNRRNITELPMYHQLTEDFKRIFVAYYINNEETELISYYTDWKNKSVKVLKKDEVQSGWQPGETREVKQDKPVSFDAAKKMAEQWRQKRRKETLQNRLDQQFAFIREIDKEKFITRQTYLSDGVRKENDAEHAWHMAVMAALLSGYANTAIDLQKTMLMLLTHDLVEIDAGDTYAYDEVGKKTQRAREEKAADRLYALLPEDQGVWLRDLFEEFDTGQTPEALFARALDRIQPTMLNAATGGKGWEERGVRLSQWMGRNTQTEEGSRVLWEYVLSHFVMPFVQSGKLKNE